MWGLLDDSPQRYAIVRKDLDGNPVEMTGADLRARLQAEEIMIYSARYRLVMTPKAK